MAFGGLILSAGLSGGLMWLSMQARVIPYVVAVDRLGEARAVQPADKDYQPTDPEIAWFLARFIRDVRSISLDPVLMRANWLSAYGFVTDRGARFLSAYARSANPFGEVGTRTLSVQVTSVVRASDRSFQVKWTETQFDRGNAGAPSHWTAILSIVRQPPASAETLRRNPLGLYIDAIDWSEELEPAAAAPQSPPAPSSPPNLPLGSPLDPGLAASPSPSGPPARNVP